MTRAIILAGYVAVVTAAVSAVLRHRPARLVLLACWLWLGWHVFVRVHWR